MYSIILIYLLIGGAWGIVRIEIPFYDEKIIDVFFSNVPSFYRDQIKIIIEYQPSILKILGMVFLWPTDIIFQIIFHFYFKSIGKQGI